MLTRSEFFSEINDIVDRFNPYTYDGKFVDIDSGSDSSGLQRIHVHYLNGIVLASNPMALLIALERAWEWYVEEYNNP